MWRQVAGLKGLRGPSRLPSAVAAQARLPTQAGLFTQAGRTAEAELANPVVSLLPQGPRSYATVGTPAQKKAAPVVQRGAVVGREDVTTLANGVRVVSEAVPGPFAGIGVFVEAGARFEDESLRGVSHIVDRLAFKSTAARGADDMVAQVDALGGNMTCASSREAMMYQALTFNGAVDEAASVLAETVRDPRITPAEVADQVETARYELQMLWAKPDVILPELVHTAAYKDNTLGHPLLCPRERLDAIDRDAVLRYRHQLYRPERIVLAFQGVDHHHAVSLAERLFGDMKPPPPLSTPSTTPSINTSTDSLSPLSSSPSSFSPSSSLTSSLLSKVPFFQSLSTSAPHSAAVTQPQSPGSPDPFGPSQYTGGFLRLPTQPVSPIATQPNFTHIHLAFEGHAIRSDDLYALATLQFLLGGGGSFSAGGPGKGMYSRLYTNVLNQYAWVESCFAFNNAYSDSGLFGISASCHPAHAQSMLDVMCRELRNLTLSSSSSSPHALQAAEVARAKNQLCSSLLMNLESRAIALEDLGRQIQIHGRRMAVQEMCLRIRRLTIADLQRVATQVLHGLVVHTTPATATTMASSRQQQQQQQQKPRGPSSGAPTVVIQEADVEPPSPRSFVQSFRQPADIAPLGWDQIQETIYRWGLGKR